MFVSVTRGIFVLCHHIVVNLFVRKPELNDANLPNFDLNSCHFCPSFFFVHQPYKQSQKKSTFQPKSQILIFILTYPDSLPIIIYEIGGKKQQVDCSVYLNLA
jgi:hypothetical protein